MGSSSGIDGKLVTFPVICREVVREPIEQNSSCCNGIAVYNRDCLRLARGTW